MIEKVVELKKKGYEPYLDFVKAYAIICVLLGHTLPLDNLMYGVWCGMQVPLFVLVQCFHVFKKEDSYIFDFKKIVKRIFIPFFFVQIVLFVLLLLGTDVGFEELLSRCLIGGGMGPGSYYPWVYLQIALVMPFLYSVFKKYSLTSLIIAGLFICELFEILFSLVNFPDSFYRLLAIRYLFLFVLAYEWMKKGLVFNNIHLILSLISLLAIVYFEYFSVNDQPWFFHTDWLFHRWPCYFFVAYLGANLLHYFYGFISNISLMDKFVQMLAKCSYEIFLVQMFLCVVTPSLDYFNNLYFSVLLRAVFIISGSIGLGIIFNKVYNFCFTSRG